MPLREVEAIALRTYRLGEADKIVSLLTRQMGRMRAVASGAQRTKSRYGGTLEPLSHIRIWLYERENRDLVRLNSCELIESFFEMQKDYRVQVAAQYVVEASEKFLPERETNERAFRLLLAVLRAIKRSGEITRPLVYFNYWLLRLGGFLPDLGRCGACGRALGEEAAFYGEGSESPLCSDCRGGAREALSQKVRSIEFEFRKSPLDAWIANAPVSPGMNELRRFLEVLVEGHVGSKLITRPLLAQA